VRSRLVGAAVAGALALVLAVAPVTLAVGPDLAAGVLPTASSSFTGCPNCNGPVAATDGNDATVWAGNADAFAWLQVDLGSAVAVVAYRVVTVNCVFSLSSSSDGSVWTDRATGLGAATGLDVDGGQQPLATVTARYWRMTGNGSCVSNTPYPGVRTLSLYAPTPTPTPTPTATPTAAPSAAPPGTPTPAPLVCSPSCAVELVTADRDRLDLLTFTAGLGSAVVAGLMVALVIGSLRRG